MQGRGTALITGATGGIGEELCREFARQGYDLVITARDRIRLERQAVRLRKTYGVGVQLIAEDLTQPDACRRIHSWLCSNGVQVDVLVNNAGFGAGDCFAGQSADVQEEMIAVNIQAPTRLCRLLLPEMLARRSGHILNIASTGAFVPGPMNAVYCAAKAYVLSLSEALSRETAASGVQVTAVCPGATRTGFAHRARMEETVLFNLGVLSPKQVAKEAYAAMVQHKTVHVVGGLNRTAMFVTRLAPRSVSTKVSGFVQKPR